MTDYLERLLEQQEQEGGDVLQWHRARTYATQGKTAGTRDAAEQATPTAVEARAMMQEGRTQGTAQLLEQVQRLHRAVQQAGEKHRERMLSPAAAPVDLTEGRYGAVRSARRTADYVAAVDAAFQRDARRYDGPMELP